MAATAQAALPTATPATSVSIRVSIPVQTVTARATKPNISAYPTIPVPAHHPARLSKKTAPTVLTAYRIADIVTTKTDNHTTYLSLLRGKLPRSFLS